MREMDLELKNIRKSYGEGDSKQEVLRGISFELKAGDICVLLGPSIFDSENNPTVMEDRSLH